MKETEELPPDEIRVLAHRKWEVRIEKGEEGDAESDWCAAEQELRGGPAEDVDDVPIRTGLDPSK